MLIFICVMIYINLWKRSKLLSIILIIGIIFWVILLVNTFFHHFIKIKNLRTRIPLNKFSNILEIQKKWEILSYPEITILSDIDGEVMSVNIMEWDIVDEWMCLMQLKSDKKSDLFISDPEVILWVINEDYNFLVNQYKEFQSEYWEEIENLKKELLNKQNALIQAMEFNDNESRKILDKEIQDLSERTLR